MPHHTLIKNADIVVTMNPAREELPVCDILITDGVISAIGANLACARGCGYY